ncbi:MAG: hypothetical protein COB67_11020 [SAR324 cluster bacterium]|uniref:Thioredoxin domain-containing protein n=1 Tax=SAR324 cluster bacterium TaxID=2024889 RepID=A0A2A4SVE3_9DELT|nr:MAG: hypothetical protein COB67_11020 [SAR324 cluster bacterium]
MKKSILSLIAFSICFAGTLLAGGTLDGIKPPYPIQKISPPVEVYAFSLVDPQNNPVKLGDYKGKILLLNFWATWCIPCVKEMPDFEALLAALEGEDFAILGINVMDSKSRVLRFLKQKKITLPIALDAKGIYPKYKVQNFPTTLILNKEGQEIGRTVGIREWDSPESIEFFRTLSRKL